MYANLINFYWMQPSGFFPALNGYLSNLVFTWQSIVNKVTGLILNLLKSIGLIPIKIILSILYSERSKFVIIDWIRYYVLFRLSLKIIFVVENNWIILMGFIPGNEIRNVTILKSFGWPFGNFFRIFDIFWWHKWYDAQMVR